MVAKGEQARKSQPMIDTNNVTLIAFVSAGGDCMDPMIVYPDDGCKETAYEPRRNLTLEDAYPKDWFKVATKSGFCNASVAMQALQEWEQFSRYVECCSVLEAPHIRPKNHKGEETGEWRVLFMDGCGTHISAEIPADFFRALREKHVHIIKLPANTTHQLQPLDLHYFGMLELALSRARENWRNGSRRAITMYTLPRVLVTAWEEVSNSVDTIQKSFRYAKLYPLGCIPGYEGARSVRQGKEQRTRPSVGSSATSCIDVEDGDYQDSPTLENDQDENDVIDGAPGPATAEAGHAALLAKLRDLIKDVRVRDAVKAICECAPCPHLNYLVECCLFSRDPEDGGPDTRPGRIVKTTDNSGKLITGDVHLEEHRERNEARKRKLQKKKKSASAADPSSTQTGSASAVEPHQGDVPMGPSTMCSPSFGPARAEEIRAAEALLDAQLGNDTFGADRRTVAGIVGVDSVPESLAKCRGTQKRAKTASRRKNIATKPTKVCITQLSIVSTSLFYF